MDVLKRKEKKEQQYNEAEDTRFPQIATCLSNKKRNHMYLLRTSPTLRNLLKQSLNITLTS